MQPRTLPDPSQYICIRQGASSNGSRYLCTRQCADNHPQAIPARIINTPAHASTTSQSCNVHLVCAPDTPGNVLITPQGMPSGSSTQYKAGMRKLKNNIYYGMMTASFPASNTMHIPSSLVHNKVNLGCKFIVLEARED